MLNSIQNLITSRGSTLGTLTTFGRRVRELSFSQTDRQTAQTLSALEALRNALYKFKTYLLTYSNDRITPPPWRTNNNNPTMFMALCSPHNVYLKLFYTYVHFHYCVCFVFCVLHLYYILYCVLILH